MNNDRYNEILDIICKWANKHNLNTWERYVDYQELAAQLDEKLDNDPGKLLDRLCLDDKFSEEF